jgi:flagellar basal body-associated protein FliL
MSSSSNTSSNISETVTDTLVAYGRIRATISLVVSIVFAVVLMISAYLAYNSKITITNTVNAHVVKKTCTSGNTCNLVVQYNIDGRNIQANTTGPSTTQIGDTINLNLSNSNVNTKPQNNKKTAFVMCSVALVLLSGGIVYYRFVMKNKYAAISNVFTKL